MAFSGYSPADVCTTTPALVVPVTARVTGLTCPLPGTLVWNGSQMTLANFVSAVKGLVEGATFNAGTCVFSAPVGSVFPPLVVSAVTVVPPVTNGSVITPCPTGFPVMYLGVRYDNLLALKVAIETFYGVGTCYDTATCTLTRVTGTCTLPSAIPIENNCGFYLSGGTVKDINGNALFRIVSAPPALLPLAGFEQIDNLSGGLVSLVSKTARTACGIIFSVPYLDVNGNIVGYGVAL